MAATPDITISGGFSGRFLLFGLIGLLIAFLPSILAVLKGTFNKGQIIKNQLIFFVITILLVGIFFVMTSVLPLGLPKAIYTIAGGLWLLICAIVWIYIMLCAIKDTPVRLF